MTPRLAIAAAALVVLLLGLAGGGAWLVGRAQYRAGVADQVAAHAAAAVDLNRVLRDQKVTADRRVAALNAKLRQTEGKLNAEIARLTQTDDTFAAWLALPVHPSDIDLVNRLRQQNAGGPDGLPARPGPDPAVGPP